MSWPAQAWHWLTTTRYTRQLEERVAYLEKEREALLTALFGKQHVPDAAYREFVRQEHPASATTVKAHRPVQPIKTWTQVRLRLEAEAAKRAEERRKQLESMNVPSQTA